uniref:DNA-directed DNA polymerase n=1 Tax=Tanacetum cinerariifolium TaxID=118510 RepID=A0A699H6G6_TANCI|nr:DNA-directed DNA polymerase [Tanacetum cinerariifolium]
MADQRTMAELLRAPTEGYAEEIVVPPILAEQFELKHSLINMMTSNQFFGIEKDNPHDHIRWGNPSAWDRYKDRLRACPHHGFTKLHQLDTFYNALNRADQDSLNSVAGGNLLERRTQDVLTIIKNQSKVRNSRNKSIVSQVKSSDANSSSSSEIAKLTHAVNQQTSVMTTAMTAILKQFQATPPPTFVKVVEEICVTCGGAHPYYQCLAASGNTFSELQDNIQGYVSAAAVNYNQVLFQMNTASTSSSGHLLSNTIANPKGELKAITTRSGIVLDGPSVPIPPLFINPEEDERLHINITLADALILIPKYQKMLKALLSNKEKLLEMTNIPLNENCSAVILKKLPEKLGDPGKFLIPCGFSKLKCKALADLGTSINLMPLSVWKKLGLPELIFTRMTLELANQAICTPTGIARDVFFPVGKFTFPAYFVIVNYKSDSRVPLVLGRPFLCTARALIDVYGEEMILRDGDERLTLNMRNDTSSYSNQPKKESINIINIFNDSSEDFLENLFATIHQSGNPTFSSHPELTSPEVKDDIFDQEGGNVLIKKYHFFFFSNHLLEEFADDLALITFPQGNDDLPFDIRSDLEEIKYLLNNNPIKDTDSILEDLVDEDNLADLNDNLADTMPEMFIDEHALDYLSPLLYDEYDDNLFEVEFDTEYVYDDPFDSKGEKIKESKLLIDELDLPRSSDFLPSSEYDSFLFEDFSEVDALPSTDNEDKIKKIAISHASLILEDFDPPLYELPFLKEVLGSQTLLSFSSENEEKNFKPKILTSKGVYFSLLLKISHQGHKVFKIIKILESPMEIFPCFCEEDIRILDVPYLHFYPPSPAQVWGESGQAD